MRRIIAFFLLAAMLLSVSACNQKKTKYTDYSFDFFDTATTIVGYEQSKEDFDRTCAEIKALLGEYHRLYDISSSNVIFRELNSKIQIEKKNSFFADTETFARISENYF